MSFPEDDRLWNETLAVARRVGSPGAILLAPHQFMEKLASVRPAQFSFFLTPEEVDTIIVHKGKIDEYDRSFLDAFIERSRYATANEVFALFSNAAEAPAERQDHAHLQTLIDRLKSHALDIAIDVQRERGMIPYLKAKGRQLWPRRDRVGRRFLICSANGFGNLGDDAVTEALADIVREVEPTAEVVITNPPPQRKYVEDADVVLVGGGGLFYDRDFPNAINYTQYLFWARELGKPAMAVGVGTQGIRTDAGKRLFREALDHCGLITVRDDNDREVLEKQVGVRPPVHVTRDLAFLLTKSPCSRSIRRDKPLLLFALSDVSSAARYAQYRRTAERCIADLLEDYDVQLMLHSYRDRRLYERLNRTFGCPIINVIGQAATRALSVYEGADLVITSRYHGLIFSLLQGVPVVPVSTPGTKVERLVRYGLSSLADVHIEVSNFTPDALKERLSEVRSGALTTQSRQEVEACIQLARSNVGLLRQALDTCPGHAAAPNP